MRLNLLFAFLLFCAISKGQSNTELKDFINKNHVAIINVQKNMVYQNLTEYTSVFKELVKNQEAAVKLYSVDKKNSAALAFSVRTESIMFIKKYTKDNTSYFEPTNEENTKFSSQKITDLNFLSDKESKAIDDMNVFNFQTLGNLILTIQ